MAQFQYVHSLKLGYKATVFAVRARADICQVVPGFTQGALPMSPQWGNLNNVSFWDVRL